MASAEASTRHQGHTTAGLASGTLPIIKTITCIYFSERASHVLANTQALSASLPSFRSAPSHCDIACREKRGEQMRSWSACISAQTLPPARREGIEAAREGQLPSRRPRLAPTCRLWLSGGRPLRRRK